jgi:hypothetical protein
MALEHRRRSQAYLARHEGVLHQDAIQLLAVEAVRQSVNQKVLATKLSASPGIEIVPGPSDLRCWEAGIQKPGLGLLTR